MTNSYWKCIYNQDSQTNVIRLETTFRTDCSVHLRISGKFLSNEMFVYIFIREFFPLLQPQYLYIHHWVQYPTLLTLRYNCLSLDCFRRADRNFGFLQIVKTFCLSTLQLKMLFHNNN